MNVIFLGPPGSGKGTMAAIVAERMNLEHISTGDMLRAEIKEGTELGKLAQSFIEKGALVPDDVIINMIRERLQQDNGKDGVLLDGFPRTIKQAEELDAIAVIDAVINLTVDVSVIVDRVLSRRICPNCGAVYSIKTYDKDVCEVCSTALVQRADDNEETIRERFRVYEEQTLALIDYYSNKFLLADVDATLPIEEEANLICDILERK